MTNELYISYLYLALITFFLIQIVFLHVIVEVVLLCRCYLVSSKKWLLPLLKQVYRVTVEPIIPTIFQRTKATCFAYGQTGRNSFLLFLLQMLAIYFFLILSFAYIFYFFTNNCPGLIPWIYVPMFPGRKKGFSLLHLHLFSSPTYLFWFPLRWNVHSGMIHFLFLLWSFLLTDAASSEAKFSSNYHG